MSGLALIGVDWGTSSLRAYAIDGEGRIIDQQGGGQGILHVAEQRFDPTLSAMIGDWQGSQPVPVVLSGMITSRNGWCETPYLPVPCTLHDLAGGLIARRSAAGWPLWFVPGVSQAPGASPEALHDVMRGEETELLGWLSAHDQSSGWFVLPGTHCKWVRIQDVGVRRFTTFMTGEVFTALCSHTILGRLMVPDAPFDSAAFKAGVDAAGGSARTLLAQLFAVRAMPLLGAMPPEQIRDYLAGLLIGSEVMDMLRVGVTDPVVIGRGDLVMRYCLALEHHGVAARAAEANLVAHGHLALARSAGIR